MTRLMYGYLAIEDVASRYCPNCARTWWHYRRRDRNVFDKCCRCDRAHELSAAP